MEYRTVRRESTAEFTEKRSRFLGHCKPVRSEEEALAFLAEKRSRYWDATHNVYAYILRENGIQRYSDDGEPQGTAGVPVLEVLKKAGLCDLVVVVTRYFGGILLGGGGLVRAYSHSASLAVAASEKVLLRQCPVLSLRCDYSLYGKVQGLIPDCGGTVDDTLFQEDVLLRFHLPEDSLGNFTRRLADLSGGKLSPAQEGMEFFEFEAGE